MRPVIFLLVLALSSTLAATAFAGANHCPSASRASDWGYAKQRLHVRCGFQAEGKGEIDCSARSDFDRVMPYNGGQVVTGGDGDRFTAECDGLPACDSDGVVSYERVDPRSSNRDDQFDSYFFSGDGSPIVEISGLDWDSCSQTREATLSCADGAWQYEIPGSCEIDREN